MPMLYNMEFSVKPKAFDPRASDLQAFLQGPNKTGTTETPRVVGFTAEESVPEAPLSTRRSRSSSVQLEPGFNRKGEALRNLIEQLALKSAKSATLVKYHEALTLQVKERYKLAIAEVYSKRNEVASSLDAQVDQAVAALRTQHDVFLMRLERFHTELETEMEATHLLAEEAQAYPVETSYLEFVGFVQSVKAFLQKGLPAVPAADFQLDSARFNWKIVEDFEGCLTPRQTTERVVVTEKRSRRFASQPNSQKASPVRTCPAEVIFSSFRNSSKKIPFLGFHKVKVYLSSKEFYVARITSQTTVGELLTELQQFVTDPLRGCRVKCVSGEGEEYLTSSTVLSSKLAPGTYLVLVRKNPPPFKI